MESQTITPKEPEDRKTRSRKNLILPGIAGFCAVILLVEIGRPRPLGSLAGSNQSTARANLVALGQALDEFAIRQGGLYPADLKSLVEPDEKGESFLGRKTLPLDPWKRNYVYSVADDARTFTLKTLGKDGKPGGTAANRDLDLSSLFEEDEF